MKPKKNPKTDLNRDRGLYFVLGLVVVLSLTYVALEWKSYENPIDFANSINVEDSIDEEVPIFVLKTPPPPPPPVSPTEIDIIMDEDDREETIIKSMETDQEEEILNVEDVIVADEAVDVEIPFIVVEDKPIFPGCEKEKDKLACFQTMMQKHIRKNFRYPELEQDLGIQGRVNIMFTIQKDGSIGNLRMRGPNENLEKEAARIIGKLPVMKPGKQAGKPVRVPFSIPITFRLQ